MPYIIRRKIRELYNRPLSLEIVLDSDTLPSHYNLDYGDGIPTFMCGKVTLLVDENNSFKFFINKDYEFQVRSRGTYDGSGGCNYDRRLTLPRELVNSFAIDSNDGIELVLSELIYKRIEGVPTSLKEDIIEKIFPDVQVRGSSDFEIKGNIEEMSATSELLVATKFTDSFYIDLAREINDAFRVRLFNATMVLLRKLFENLLVDLLRQRYVSDPSKIGLFFNAKKHQYRNFVTLKDSLKDNLIDFEPYDPLISKDKGLIGFLEQIKEKGDDSAHTLEIIQDANEINYLKPSINKYSDLLVRMYRKVKEIPN